MAQVGITLNAWNQVENTLGLLFKSVSQIADAKKAGSIFDAIVSFDSRLKALDAAIASSDYISEENREIWSVLSARLRRLYKKRHEVAHFTIPHDSFTTGDRISPYFTWNKHQKNTAKYLTIAQLHERSNKFTAACQAVSWFTVRASGDARVHPASVEYPPEGPVLIQHIKKLCAQKRGGKAAQNK
jgi:hypothetical protein